MNASMDNLSPEQHARIFREEILTNSEFKRATTQSSPKAIILGGQPGAGKGGLTQWLGIRL